MGRRRRPGTVRIDDEWADKKLDRAAARKDVHEMRRCKRSHTVTRCGGINIPSPP